MDVLLATCADLPSGDEDADVLLAAMERAGVRARWQVWSDPAASWDALTVIRSPWDYSGRREEFLAWTRAVPRLENPAALIAWNTDKTYLAELAAAGVATVPTEVLAPGSALRAPAAAEFVLKPSVGAGSRGAGRFTPARLDAAQAHAEHLHAAGRTVLVQPYLDGVDEQGERALLYFDGVFSHAVTKGAMLPAGTAHPVDGWELFVDENITPAQATPAEHAVAEAALAHLTARFGTPLYCRVDLLPSADGPRLVELEVTEPSLFLQHADGAADRFAAAVAGRR